MNSLFGKIIIQESKLLEIVNKSFYSQNHFLITYINQHCFNIYTTNNEYRNLIEDKFVVYADGIGINLVSRFLFGKKYNNFNATDLNEKIMDSLFKSGIKFFILGGNFNKEELDQKFGLLDCFVGYNSGYFLENEFDEISIKIRSLKPEVIIIGMGVPKQEIIAAKLSELVDASLFICVGNFFEFYFGTVKRIPEKYRDKGIEWIYRLFHEPKRLWKRYIIGIPLFIFRVIKYKFIVKKSDSII